MLMEVVIVAKTKVPEVELNGEGTESESSEDTSDDKDGEAALNRDAPAPSVQQEYIPMGNHDHPPTIEEAKSALDDIKKILHPP